MTTYRMIIVSFLATFISDAGSTDSTTLGTNLSYSKDVQNVGLLWTQAISKYALLDTHAASSHSDWGDGYTFGVFVKP